MCPGKKDVKNTQCLELTAALIVYAMYPYDSNCLLRTPASLCDK